MKNIFNNLQANAPEHRNAYDLSQRHILSAKVGQCLPIACFETLPKDHFEIDILSLLRSMPINTAAFTRMKAKFDFVFVPYQQLWHGWNQFFLQNDENMSSGNSFSHSSVPYFQLYSDLFQCFNEFAFLEGLRFHYKFSDETIIANIESDLIASVFSSPNDIFDENGFSFVSNYLRLLDLLGYGSFYALYDYFIYNYRLNIESYVDNELDGHWPTSIWLWPDDLAGLYDSVSSDDFFPNTLDQHAYDNFVKDFRFLYIKVGSSYSLDLSRKFNFFRVLAYQKYWQDYVMNKRVQSYSPSAFNVDHQNLIVYGDSEFFEIFKLRYSSWDYDMFTGVFDSPQTGDVSMVSGSASIVLNNPSSSAVNAQFASNSGKLIPQGIGSSTSIQGLSVYDIKRAEFMQRWKENHLRAGTKGQNQALGQWNTKFRYLSDEYSDFINSFDLNVNIDEVINTADNQGDISGKGIGTNNGHLTYDVSDAGVIMCVLSIQPRAEYDAVMLDKQNLCIEPFDWPSPFFDNLGLEAIPAYLLSLFTPDYSRVIGYSPRYLPWKTAVDKVHGQFMSHAGYFDPNLGDGFKAGGFSVWVTPRRELVDEDSKFDVNQLFYVNPSVCDSIFAAIADSSQETDHFILNTNFVCHVVRNLSVSGMPNWNV